MRTWREHFPNWRDDVLVHPAAADVIAEGPRDEAELAFARFADEAEKVEVHVHAEAAVPAAFYAGLPAGAADTVTSSGPFTDFMDFLRRWMRNLGALRRPSDYAALGRAFIEDRAARRIAITECHLSPLDTSRYRARFAPDLPALDLGESIGQFVAGLREGTAACRGAARARVIVDLVHIAAEEDLEAAWAALGPFVGSEDNRDADGEPVVVGVGLGGPERPERAPFFAEALRRFRDLGLKLDLHSGEQRSVTPAQHEAAVTTLRPERVGHGIRGAAAGFFYGGAIAACPLSNLLLGCHEGPLSSHPIGEMVRRGLDVSVNSDDPLLFGTNLVLEFVALRRAFGWDREFFLRSQERARGQLFVPPRGSAG